MIRSTFILAFVMWLSACTPPGQGEGSGEGIDDGAAVEEVDTATLVETATLEATQFEERLELYGETAPVRTALVSAQVGGRIVSLDMAEGQAVVEGDTVMRLNASQGRAAIDRLDVVVDQLEAEIERTERLIDRGLATQSQLDQLVAERNANREAIGEVRAGVRETNHRAPISGIVTDTFNEEGEFAGQGNAVARIIDIDTIVVLAGLPERDIEYVSEGQVVEVEIVATGARRTGTIHRVGMEANTRNRTFPLEIHIPNADHALRAGMRAKVILVKRNILEAVLIPRDAVVQSIDGPEVFLVSDMLAEARPVELGPSQGRYVVVTSGLVTGDELVVRGQRALIQGEELEVMRTATCCASQFEVYLHGETDE